MKIRADMKPAGSDKIIAFGDVYLDEKVVIHNVRVVQAEKNGSIYHFVCHFLRKGLTRINGIPSSTSKIRISESRSRMPSTRA